MLTMNSQVSLLLTEDQIIQARIHALTSMAVGLLKPRQVMDAVRELEKLLVDKLQVVNARTL